MSLTASLQLEHIVGLLATSTGIFGEEDDIMDASEHNLLCGV
jgi:hypothetical protein